MPQRNRLEQRKRTWQEPDPNLNPATIAASAMPGLVRSSPTEPSGCASQKGTLGRGISGRLSPPADSLSSFLSTSACEVFTASSSSRRVGTSGQGFYAVRSPKLQPTEGMSLRSSWLWARLQGIWPCGRRMRLWLWGMLANHLALLW